MAGIVPVMPSRLGASRRLMVESWARDPDADSAAAAAAAAGITTSKSGSSICYLALLRPVVLQASDQGGGRVEVRRGSAGNGMIC